MEVTQEHQSFVDGMTIIKQEPVEADPRSLKQEFEYVCIKEERPEWEVPAADDVMQDPLSIVKEECSPPEDFVMCSTLNINKTEDEEDEQQAVSKDDEKECSSLDEFPMPSTSSIEKMEGEEDEEALSEDDFDKLRHEGESTSSGSQPESTTTTDVEDGKSNEDSGGLVTTVSLAAQIGNRIHYSTKQEASYRNKVGTKGPGHSCAICKKTFPQLQDLKDHRHIGRCKFLLSCSICHKTVRCKSELEVHFRVHTGERPYSCRVCNKTFKAKNTLKTHSQLHTAERRNEPPYSCVLCDKTFTWSNSLKEHVRLHTGERPYSCSICNKSFVQSSTLKQHLRLHTGERPYSCDICNKTFTRIDSVKKHFFRKHAGEHT